MNKFMFKYTLNIWFKFSLSLFAVFSAAAWFVPCSDGNMELIKIIVGIVLITLLIASYLVICTIEKKSKRVKLFINNTEVNIFFGDLFNQEGKKVIAFNEYFDTQVDDTIIAHKSLNGIVIDKGLISAQEFDKAVSANKALEKNGISNRTLGKTQKYKLGQIQPYKDYYALALTRFNKNNEAFLNSNDYSNCLLEMWRQLNKYYALNIVNIPLLGSGITRIVDNSNVSNQELLEIMLETLKISKMTFKEPSKLNIILHPGLNNCNIKKYDFIRIKYLFRR